MCFIACSAVAQDTPHLVHLKLNGQDQALTKKEFKFDSKEWAVIAEYGGFSEMADSTGVIYLPPIDSGMIYIAVYNKPNTYSIHVPYSALTECSNWEIRLKKKWWSREYNLQVAACSLVHGTEDKTIRR